MTKAMYQITFRDKSTNNVTEVSRIVKPATTAGLFATLRWAEGVCEKYEYVAGVEQLYAETTG